MTDQDPKPEDSAPDSSGTVEEPIAAGVESEAERLDGPMAADERTAGGDDLDDGVEPVEAEPAADASHVEAGARARGRGAGRTAEPGTPAPGRTVDELPYVDDPVTKWWVGIVVAVFVVIFAYALLLGRGGFLTDLLSSDPPAPASSPTVSLEPSPITEPSPSPAVASPAPTPTPAAPTPGPTPSPPATPAPTAPVAVTGSPGPTAESPAPAS
jgi:hypothetical protein